MKQPQQTTSSEKKSNIFRHLRPRYFNSLKHSLDPHFNGGISFLLRPVGEGEYSFWVYICPPTAGFSSKQAVRSLVETADRGTVPWGTLHITEEPLLDQLIRFMIREDTKLPSETGKQVLKIVITNAMASHQQLKAQTEAAQTTRRLYNEYPDKA